MIKFKKLPENIHQKIAAMNYPAAELRGIFPSLDGRGLRGGCLIIFTPTILLAKAEILDDFLNEYKGEVIIPNEVKEECCGRKNSFDALLIGKRIEELKIKTGKIRNVELCEKFMKDFSIAKGEAEALVLFTEKKAKAQLFAADDKNAIKACKILMIPFTSALAILTRLVEKGIIDNSDAKIKIGMLARYGRYKESMIKEAAEYPFSYRWNSYPPLWKSRIDPMRPEPGGVRGDFIKQ